MKTAATQSEIFPGPPSPSEAAAQESPALELVISSVETDNEAVSLPLPRLPRRMDVQRTPDAYDRFKAAGQITALSWNFGLLEEDFE